MRFFESIPKKYLVGMATFICAVTLFATFGSRGIFQIYQLKKERDKIKVSNARLQEENQRLAEQIQRLRHKEEVERVAREELGLVKQGEIVYQFEK